MAWHGKHTCAEVGDEGTPLLLLHLTRVPQQADEGSVREVERRMAALQRQADHASEGVRALTQSTYKRVDEHASAIQRLTLVGGGVKGGVSTGWGLLQHVCRCLSTSASYGRVALASCKISSAGKQFSPPTWYTALLRDTAKQQCLYDCPVLW
jgi:hypothetical protein